MVMKTKLSLLFYLKKPRNYQDGSIPIYLRVTVDGKRSEIATGRDYEPKMWNAAAGRMLGKKEAVKSAPHRGRFNFEIFRGFRQ